MERTSYRTVVVSDIHLGTKYSKVNQVSDFLTTLDCEKLILNGDTIDGWQLQKNDYQYWGAEQARFFRIIMKIIDPDIAAGYSSLIAVLLLIGGVLMLMLGIIGEYVGRIYISLNNSPQYVIRDEVNFDGDTDKAD